MKQWYLVIDVDKCENCNNCFLSCKDEHVDNEWQGYAAPQPGQGQSWIEIRGNVRGQYPCVDVAYLPFLCMQCEDAPCVKAANGAIAQRPDGIIIIDPVKAKGQKKLVNACPYNMIRWNEQLELPQKCTLCAHLLDAGWGKTRCVQSCPTGALNLQRAEEVEMRGIVRREGLQAYQPERRTQPRVYYKNLYRFTRCFIGGSVAVRAGDKEECAQRAHVTLLNAAQEKVGESTTDNYGDFKFDNLEGNGSRYTLRIAFRDCDPKTVAVTLKQSQYVGTILF